jgi:hypothetical protein
MDGYFMVKFGPNFVLSNLKFNIDVKVALRLKKDYLETRALEFRLSA